MNQEQLSTIWFEGEMLPGWAQLLDLAARLCPVSESTRNWFSRFTNASGVEDATTVTAHCESLRNAICQRKEALTTELERTRDDHQARQVVAAWEYALNTMLQVAAAQKTCSWTVDGAREDDTGGSGNGNIALRRV